MADPSNFKLTDEKGGQNEVAFDFGLLANFVHQVINPLSGTSGIIGNLIDGTIPESRRDQRLRSAKAQLEHSISLMRNLAYFSQISIDPTNTNPGAIQKTCVIPQVIIESIQFYQEMAQRKNIAVEHMNRWDQFKVQGNPDLLRQVFMNLIDNAVKYANNGTRVEFIAREHKRAKSLAVDIVSQGQEVKPVELEKVFSLGFRGINAQQKVASGTGLGLHICRTIIEGVHKGTIKAYSTRSGRTTFRIMFPGYWKD